MKRSEYSRYDVTQRAKQFLRAKLFKTWGEALRAAYAELEMRNR